MALKLDMSKAYDRVDWNFLKAFMGKLGFDKKWIELVMKHVTLVSYAILLNGEPILVFYPSCGLLQGDSLSLYFFLLCVEFLFMMIHKVEAKELIYGTRI